MYFEIPGRNIRVLGALHAFPPTAPDLPSWVDGAFSWADQIWTEHDNKRLDPFRYENDGKTPKPWQQYFIELRSALGDLHLGVEGQFAARLQSLNRAPMRSLEDEASFAGLLDQVPIGAFRAARAEMQRTWDRAPVIFSNFHAAWSRADSASIHRLLSSDPIYTIKPLREAMLIKRNRQWAKDICALGRQTERNLIVVGCLHLIGKDNLIELIKARGRKAVLLS